MPSLDEIEITHFKQNKQIYVLRNSNFWYLKMKEKSEPITMISYTEEKAILINI